VFNHKALKTIKNLLLRGDFAVNFQQSVTTCLKKFVDFDGRASRSEYWWFFLFNLGVTLVAYMLHETLGSIVSLLLLLPGIAAAVRRMHDIGKSGWFMLLGLIPLVGLILLYWAVQPSAPESNEYGEPPAA
jgi:uncharacterized membrane protein YhaH (DUF805 family)